MSSLHPLHPLHHSTPLHSTPLFHSTQRISTNYPVVYQACKEQLPARLVCCNMTTSPSLVSSRRVILATCQGRFRTVVRIGILSWDPGPLVLCACTKVEPALTSPWLGRAGKALAPWLGFLRTMCCHDHVTWPDLTSGQILIIITHKLHNITMACFAWLVP